MSSSIPRRASSLIYLVPIEWLKRRNYNCTTNNSSFDYKLLLLERNESSRSFAKSSTFPGGALENIDGQLGDEDKVCAVRESFEEAGFLICKEKVPVREIMQKDWRNIVHNDATQFKQMLSQYNLTLDLESLIPYQRWITPEQAPSRFDTKFYISNPKNEQDFDFDISHDGTENTNSVWMSPDEAISNFLQKKILLAPPTYCILNHLCKYQNWEHVIHDSRNNAKIDFEKPIIPIMINNKDESIRGVYGERVPKQLIILPGDCLHKTSSSFGVPNSYHRLEIYGPNDYSLITQRESKL